VKRIQIRRHCGPLCTYPSFHYLCSFENRVFPVVVPPRDSLFFAIQLSFFNLLYSFSLITILILFMCARFTPCLFRFVRKLRFSGRGASSRFSLFKHATIALVYLFYPISVCSARVLASPLYYKPSVINCSLIM